MAGVGSLTNGHHIFNTKKIEYKRRARKLIESISFLSNLAQSIPHPSAASMPKNGDAPQQLSRIRVFRPLKRLFPRLFIAFQFYYFSHAIFISSTCVYLVIPRSSHTHSGTHIAILTVHTTLCSVQCAPRHSHNVIISSVGFFSLQQLS